MTAVGAITRANSSKRLQFTIGIAAILSIQVIVIIAGDSRAFSGSDAGGRAASVQAAVENGGCDHDLDYWASTWDPEGVAHPMLTSATAEDRFVQPASIPYVCSASIASRTFGQPWGLAVPVTGVLMAAAGAWLLDRELGGSGLLAMLLVGAVGPVAFYGSDHWEHAPAVGCAVLGTAVILVRGSMASGVVGGLLWGLALTLRTETAIVALTLAVAVAMVGPMRRSFLERWSRSLLLVVSAVAVGVLDRFLQARLIGTDYRTARAGGQVSSAATDLGERASDALVTSFALVPTIPPTPGIAIGSGLVVCVLVLALCAKGSIDSRIAAAGFAAAAIGLVGYRMFNLGFVPGLFAATPLAVFGVVVAGRAAPALVRVLAGASLLALPAVWALQWTGNLGPQWGGRYSLTSGVLLVVCGLVLVRESRSLVASAGVLVASLLIGVTGLVWHVERTQTFAAVVEQVLELPCEDVLISTSTYLLREGGSFVELRTGVRDDGCRMLNGGDGRLQLALEVARESGADSVTLLAVGRIESDPESLERTEIIDRDFIELAGSPHTLFFLSV